LTEFDLPSTGPVLEEHCGTCRACLDACPTGAITEPWFVDAARCISYLTIEHRGPIPEEFHATIGDRLFGCDVCQDVCPQNRRAEATTDPVFAPDPRLTSMSLADLLKMDEGRFRSTFRGTPLSRPRRSGLLRNALIVAANTADGDASAAARTLVGDPDPTIREMARRLAESETGAGAPGGGKGAPRPAPGDA
jgi:epoxyqueuosine reductase